MSENELLNPNMWDDLKNRIVDKKKGVINGESRCVLFGIEDKKVWKKDVSNYKIMIMMFEGHVYYYFYFLAPDDGKAHLLMEIRDDVLGTMYDHSDAKHFMDLVISVVEKR